MCTYRKLLWPFFDDEAHKRGLPFGSSSSSGGCTDSDVWDLVSVGDINGDGATDAVLRASSTDSLGFVTPGDLFYALSEESGLAWSGAGVGSTPVAGWSVVGLGFDGNTHSADFGDFRRTIAPILCGSTAPTLLGMATRATLPPVAFAPASSVARLSTSLPAINFGASMITTVTMCTTSCSSKPAAVTRTRVAIAVRWSCIRDQPGCGSGNSLDIPSTALSVMTIGIFPSLKGIRQRPSQTRPGTPTRKPVPTHDRGPGEKHLRAAAPPIRLAGFRLPGAGCLSGESRGRSGVMVYESLLL